MKPALQRLVKNGVKLHAYSPEILRAAHKVAFDLYKEESGKNPAWKKIYDSWKKFRQNQLLWRCVSQRSLSEFLFTWPGK